MTKISTYVVDEKVTALDKWIGSDANMQNRTKNFTPKKLAAYFNEDQVINIGTPLQYKYYTLDPLEARPNGTLTFETEIGPTVNFSSITTFLLSKYTTKQNIVSDFLNFLDGSKVLLFKSSDINSFGFYRISSLEPYEPDPNFFVVTVEYETGHGALEEDEDYMISLVSLAGGSIPTKTSQLINDGDDGVNPFISELDIDRTEWDAAYEGKINSAEVTGDTTKTLTLTKQDGSTIETSWTDSDTGLTSVGVSMPSAFSVTNSPLTSNGTITITGAGTSLEYVRGDGTLGTFPTLTGYVPYTGATQSVDLGTNLLSSGRIHIEGTDENTGSYLGFRQYLSVTTSSEGYTSLYAFGSQSLQFLFNQGGTDNKKFTFNVGSITANVPGGRVYSMPDADGTLALTSNLSSYVPYTGATGDVNLGAHQLKADSLAVSTTSVETVDVGEIVWNAVDGTFDMGLIGGVTLQAGQELHMYGKATEVILNGQAVMFAGVQGDHILIAKADAATINANPEYLIGVATQDFAINDFGYVTVFGNVRGLDTTAYTLGSVLYYNSESATDGLLTSTMPTAPNAKIIVAAVVRVHATQGILLVRPHTMPKLKDIQDVYAPSPFSNNGLFWNSSTLRYENNSIIGALGYTPYNATNPSNYITLGSISSTATGLTYTNTTGVFSLTSGYIIPTTTEESNWNDAYSNRITSASTPLSISSNAISISQAGTSTNGYLTSSDWNTFNNKQVAGNYITSLTGEATASGPGAASVTLNNASVTAKILSGVNITGGTILDTDTMLTAFGKLQNQINSLIGGSIYQGVWNASTNTPTLTSSVGTDGNYYIVNVAGSTDLNGITDWKVGDWAIFHGGTWQKVDNTDAVSSVNGFTGAVSLTTDNIPEGTTNLYFTDARVSANTDVTANTASRHNPVTISTTGSINGLNIDVSQQLSITTASSTQNGALSSTDWNTFNNKQNALTNPVTGTGGNTEVAFFNSTGSTITSHPSIKIVGGQLQTASLKVLTFGAGMVYSDSIGNVGTLTGIANELTYWSSNGTIGSLSTATYPNLTELSYLKGVTSSIQTQINSKQNVLTNPITGTGTTNYLPKFTGASSLGNSLIFDNGTNVGIGTTSPSYLLDVNGGGIFRGGVHTGGSFINGVRIGYDTTNNYGFLEAVQVDATPRPLRVNQYGGVTSFGGNLGIGTTSPSEKLEVNGYILSNDGSYGGKILLGSSSGPYISGNALTGQLGLSSSAGSPSMVIDISGNVGIGTAIGAGYKLDVNGTGRFTQGVNLATSSGNVGIGTTSPSAKLEVAGSIKYANKANYNINVSVGSSSTIKWILQSSNGINVTTTSTNKVYRLQLTTISTSVNTGEVWIAQNIDGAGWTVKRVYSTQDIPTSVYPYMFVDTDGLPKVTLSHPSSYTVSISVEEYDGGVNGTTYSIFGLDSQISSIGGLVGIGTTAPSRTLDVNGSLGVRSGVNNATVNGHILLVPEDGLNKIFSRKVNGADSDLSFNIGSTERMRITTDGRLLIGSATDLGNYKLQLTGLQKIIGTDTHLNLGQLDANNVYFQALNTAGNAAKGFVWYGTSEYMRITSGGNVGIGTSPTTKLHVLGASEVFRLGTTTSTNYFTFFNSAGTQIGDIGYDGRATDTMAIWNNANGGMIFGANAAERMRITSAGKINVNNYAGGAYLNISGGTTVVCVETLQNGSGTLTHYSFKNSNGTVGSISTNGSSTSYNTSSDYRLKEDIKPVENALERLQNLKPVNFAWKVDGSRVDGFIAHELADVIPSAVSGEKDATEEVEITPAILDEEGNIIEEAVIETVDVYQGIDQSKIVPLLVAAMQELKAEIELLKAK